MSHNPEQIERKQLLNESKARAQARHRSLSKKEVIQSKKSGGTGKSSSKQLYRESIPHLSKMAEKEGGDKPYGKEHGTFEERFKKAYLNK